MSRREVYSAFETEGSLCVFEWLHEQLNDVSSKHYKTAVDLWESYGSSAMRFIAIQAGCIVVELYQYCETEGNPFAHLITDDFSFDWDFVPLMCKHLDWKHLANDNQYGPGDWAPEPKEFLAIMTAKRAMSLDVAA